MALKQTGSYQSLIGGRAKLKKDKGKIKYKKWELAGGKSPNNVAYFLKVLSTIECNNNIWDREFLVIVATFRVSRHLLSEIAAPM